MRGKCFYIISGEQSGDHYGAGLARALRSKAPDALFYGYGGPEMLAEGVILSRTLKDLSIMGFVEVLSKWKTILRNFRTAKQDILRLHPDAIILVDYPGFNLRMAKWAKKQGIPVFYYVAPQTWAWKRGRNRKIRKYVDKLFVILPFEEAFFRQDGIDTSYVGHPVWSEIEERMIHLREIGKKTLSENDLPTIALLPGSRKKELQQLGPVLMDLIRQMQGYSFVLAGISSLDKSLYTGFQQLDQVEIIWDDSFTVLQMADIGLIKSGTSSLQAALFKLPHVVFYRLHPLSAWLLKKWIKIDFVALPNLILNRLVVPELLQESFQPMALERELLHLQQSEIKEGMLRSFEEIGAKLKKRGNPAELVAIEIFTYLNQGTSAGKTS